MDQPHLGELVQLSTMGNRGQAVFDALRGAIREGHLRPGMPVKEEQVAEWFKVSRTPVREALARLLGRSLLERSGGRGLIVRTLDRSDLDELYAMREVLEGASAAFAAMHAGPADIQTLEMIQERFAALPGDRPAEAVRVNQRFHDAIRSIARNRYLDSALEELADSIALLGQTTLSDPDRHMAAVAEHDAILDGIRSREAGPAESAARAHIRAALRSRKIESVQDGCIPSG